MASRLVEIVLALKDRFTGEASKAADSVRGLGREAERTSTKTTKANERARRSFEEGYTKAANKAKASVLTLGNAIRALAAGQFLRSFVEANRTLESTRLAFENITGSSEEAAEQLEFLREVSTRLGLPLREASDAFVNLAAAAKGTSLEGEQTQLIFTAVAESMAKLGKTSADTEGALLAISQIISKGKVSAEELRGQLGERLPGAFQAAARAAGVTTEELDKLLSTGQLMAEDFLPSFAEELNKTFQNSGERVETFGAQWERLKNQFNEFLQIVGQTGVFNALGKGLAFVGEGLKFVTVGFVTLTSKVTAAAKSVGVFWDAITNLNFDDVGERLSAIWDESAEKIENTADKVWGLEKPIKAVTSKTKVLGEEADKAGDKVETFGKQVEKTGEQAKKAADRTQEYIDGFKAIATDVGATSELIRDSAKAYASVAQNVQTLTGLKRELRIAYDDGKIILEDYGVAMGKVNALLAEVRVKTGENTKAMREFRDALAGAETINAIQAVRVALNKAFEEGRISAEELQEAIEEIRKKLGFAAEAGREAGEAISEGMDDAAESARNAKQEIEGATQAIRQFREENERVVATNALPNFIASQVRTIAETYGQQAANAFLEAYNAAIASGATPEVAESLAASAVYGRGGGGDLYVTINAVDVNDPDTLARQLKPALDRIGGLGR